MHKADWIIEEIKTADFGDKRLDKRYGDINGTSHKTLFDEAFRQ